MFTVRPYEPADEVGWVRCRVLSFLDSAFCDAVEREKEHYENPSIELVADESGEIVGLLDLEAHGFTIDGYLHVYLEREDLRAFDGELRFVKAFAHYTGDRPDEIRKRYARVHDDVLYEKRL
jgi:hypothetical protein